MVYDPRTMIMFSGDMLYPGRLYVPVDQFATFTASADRIAGFAKTHKVRMLLGAHIEMTNTPGRDYAMRAPAHPDEHLLELPPSSILRLRDTARGMGSDPKIGNEGDFIICPRPSRPAS